MKKIEELTGWEVGSALALTALAVVLFGLIPFSIAGSECAAAIGDSFGVINAVIAGIAFLGVAYAVILQRQQLKMAVDESQESAKSQKQAAEIMLLSAYLTAYDSLIKATGDQAVDTDNSAREIARRSHRELITRLEYLLFNLELRNAEDFRMPSLESGIYFQLAKLGTKLHAAVQSQSLTKDWRETRNSVDRTSAEIDRLRQLLGDSAESSILRSELSEHVEELNAAAELVSDNYPGFNIDAFTERARKIADNLRHYYHDLADEK
jgi:hypothetical protein